MGNRKSLPQTLLKNRKTNTPKKLSAEVRNNFYRKKIARPSIFALALSGCDNSATKRLETRSAENSSKIEDLDLHVSKQFAEMRAEYLSLRNDESRMITSLTDDVGKLQLDLAQTKNDLEVTINENNRLKSSIGDYQQLLQQIKKTDSDSLERNEANRITFEKLSEPINKNIAALSEQRTEHLNNILDLTKRIESINSFNANSENSIMEYKAFEASKHEREKATNILTLRLNNSKIVIQQLDTAIQEERNKLIQLKEGS